MLANENSSAQWWCIVMSRIKSESRGGVINEIVRRFPHTIPCAARSRIGYKNFQKQKSLLSHSLSLSIPLPELTTNRGKMVLLFR